MRVIIAFESGTYVITTHFVLHFQYVCIQAECFTVLRNMHI